MRVLNISIGKVKPYRNNPRRNKEAIDAVAASIREFGFKVPIVIDKNNVIVTGHTRWKAANRLGLQTVPCIRADDLTDDQIKAFRIADNSVAEIATWDTEKLEVELGDIELDMLDFGFDFDDFNIPESEEETGYYGDERERTNKAYNLDLIDYDNLTDDFWQMPVIMTAAYDLTIKAKYHPGRGNKTAIEAVVAHEMGHRVTDVIGQKIGTGKWSLDATANRIVAEAQKKTGHRTRNSFRKSISGYARENNAETIAEAFADVYCNGKKASKASRAIIEVVDSFF